MKRFFQSVYYGIRRYIITGILILVPLIVTLQAFVWMFQFLDDQVAPRFQTWLAQIPLLQKWIPSAAEGTPGGTPEIPPGLGVVMIVVIVFLVGLIGSSFIGRKLLEGLESLIGRVPVIKTVYNMLKQLVLSFSPENKQSFKKFVLAKEPASGMYAFGFVTGEFDMPGPEGSPAPHVSVYIPTNHLYLGTTVVLPAHDIVETNISAEQGIRYVLSCGATPLSGVQLRKSIPKT